MRRLTAHYIFPVAQPPIKNGIIEIADDGTIIQVIDPNGQIIESEQLEHYNGVLVPGLVNAHCHLELSYLQNSIAPHSRLHGFISQFVAARKQNLEPADFDAIIQADAQMLANGIVLVGDISNTRDSFAAKCSSKIKYHTFVEVLSLNQEAIPIISAEALLIYNELADAFEQRASIVPHAPYTMLPALWTFVKEHALKNNSVLTIHNQESSAENEIFSAGSGILRQTLQGLSHNNTYPIYATGKNSLSSIIALLPTDQPVLFVHNTYSTQHDIEEAIQYLGAKNAFWVLCPQSNLYIEDALPPIALFESFSENILLGTDSLASNNRLSIFDEMKTLLLLFPYLRFSKVLQWATLNGAKALRYQSEFGSLEAGKRPGVNLISNFDFNNMNITENSRVTKLI